MPGSKALFKRIFRGLGLEVRRYSPSYEPRTFGERVRAGAFARLGYELRRSSSSYEPRRLGRPLVERPPVRVVHFGWARTNQLFEFLDRNLYTGWEFDAANYGVSLDAVIPNRWTLKGYGYSLVVDAATRLAERRSQPLKILDVGGGASGLARFLAERLGAEPWVVDDFGIESLDAHSAGWYRSGLRDSLVDRNPSVRYVFGRLGGQRLPELKPKSFDLICSVSTLEHIPLLEMTAVFDHMFELLDETSGVMVHAIDLPQGELKDWQYFLGGYFRLRGVDPAGFVTHELNEGPPDDPPLLESAEMLYLLTALSRGPRRMRTRFRRMSTLVLHVACGRDGSGVSA